MPNNQSYKKIIAVFLITATCFLACRKEIKPTINPDYQYSYTYSQVFEQFWAGMNDRYQYWDKDTTNWDAMYTRYKPLFDKLDIYNEDDQRKSVDYFRQMVSGNLDGHFVVYFSAPAIADSIIYTREDQNVLTIDHVKNINPILLPGEAERTPDWYYFPYYDIDIARYLDTGYIYGVYTDPVLSDITVLEGTINKNVVYIGFDQEGLGTALQDVGTNVLKSAYNAFFEALKNNPDIKGAIVDMRSSLGGYIADANLMASNMIDKPVLQGYLRYKNGTGRLDFTPWQPTYIQPAAGSKAIKVPLIILTDVLTWSGAEHVTSALHAVPGTVSIGTATRGGDIAIMDGTLQGQRYTNIETYPGYSFMSFQFSGAAFRMPDGSDTYWGIKPDIEVPFDTTAILADRDPQLEKALSLIH